MTNPMFNPQPNYSGVTIQISNPAVNVGEPRYIGVNGQRIPNGNGTYITNPQVSYYPQQYYDGYNNELLTNNNSETQIYDKNGNPIANNSEGQLNTADTNGTGYQNAYPADYYLNNYRTTNDENNLNKLSQSDIENNSTSLTNSTSKSSESNRNNNNFSSDTSNSDYRNYSNNNISNNEKGDEYNSPYRAYSSELDGVKQREDLTTSKSIIGELTERDNTIQEEKKNSKETKIVALTDEYIKSLENYLNNPNDEIRLMASKEVLTRLDEDKDRYDDAALNALLNKMLQDPAKLVRIAALSAFASQLASGNNYTVQLLNNMQSNPNADKEDVLQAADILLKMSAGVEVKRIPNPAAKDNPQQ